MKSLYLLTLATLISFSSFSQFENALNKLKKGAANVLEGNPAISTNFKDVYMEGTLNPDFGEDKIYKQLKKVPRDDEGFFLLTPGFYESTNYSYCLKAGTPGPNVSDGYGLAYLDGKMSEIVEAILARSQELWQGLPSDSSNKAKVWNTANAVAGIQQKDVQVLLWAIIAKAKFSDFVGRVKLTAAALCTPQEIVKLNGGAINTAINFASDKGWAKKPEALRKMEEAMQNMRSLCYKADATFDDFERVAILAGLSTAPQIAATNTWFKDRSGKFYVRFKPSGYSRTTVQIYIPDTETEVKFKATGIVATPDDSRQRLAQTDWFADVIPYSNKSTASIND